MHTPSRNSLIGLAIALAAVALAPASAQAADPTCNNINTGIVHNAATPLRITCTGADVGPVVKIITAPQHGTLNLPEGASGTDAWVTYTPAPGYAGSDSFTFRGVSPGTGPANSDEESVNRTAALRVGAGVAPVCANLSQTVPQATATNLRLVCASGGDPITGYAIPAGEGPDHGTLGMTAISSGLLTYTSVAGFSGADTFKYTATSTCGAPSCVSNEGIYDLTVLNPQQGPQGPQGAQGPQGDAGATGSAGAAGTQGAPGVAGTAGKDGAVVTRPKLLIASFLDSLTARRGKPVLMRYVSTANARVILEVFKGKRRVASTPGRAREGRNTIRWNGKAGGRAAAAGVYKLVLRATSAGQVVSDAATVRVTRGTRSAPSPGGAGGGLPGGGGSGGGTGGGG